MSYPLAKVVDIASQTERPERCPILSLMKPNLGGECPMTPILTKFYHPALSEPTILDDIACMNGHYPVKSSCTGDAASVQRGFPWWKGHFCMRCHELVWENYAHRRPDDLEPRWEKAVEKELIARGRDRSDLGDHMAVIDGREQLRDNRPQEFKDREARWRTPLLDQCSAVS